MGTSQKDRLGVDPDAAFSELPTATQNAIVEYLIEEEGTTEITEEVEMIVGSSAADGATAASVGCAIQTKTAIHKPNLGVSCGNTSPVRSGVGTAPRSLTTLYSTGISGPFTLGNSWAMLAVTNRADRAIGYTGTTRRATSRFCFQGDLGCPITDNYPSLTKRQYGNGSTG